MVVIIISLIITTNPNYYDESQLLWVMTNLNYYGPHNHYDSKDMVSPNYGHHDCTICILYPLYNLNCKHWTRTLANCNKCHASLLTVPCYDKGKKWLLW